MIIRMGILHSRGDGFQSHKETHVPSFMQNLSFDEYNSLKFQRR